MLKKLRKALEGDRAPLAMLICLEESICENSHPIKSTLHTQSSLNLYARDIFHKQSGKNAETHVEL